MDYSGDEQCEYCGCEGMQYTEEDEGREETCDMCGYHSYMVAEDYEGDDYEDMFTEPTKLNIKLARMMSAFFESPIGENLQVVMEQEEAMGIYDLMGDIREAVKGDSKSGRYVLQLMFRD